MKIIYFIVIIFVEFQPALGAFDRIVEEDESLISQLLSPGPLSLVHKDLEMIGCLSCHEGGAGVPNNKCLKCHIEINNTLSNKKSFHGRMNKKCIKCHIDHKGSSWDTTKVNQDKFDHELTGYKLVDKHVSVKCKKCHVKKRSKKYFRKREPIYLGAKSACINCHQKDDIHFFDIRLKIKWYKKDCSECHSIKGWKENINFDHFKESKYKLIGAHKKLNCRECHLPQGKKESAIYKWNDLKNKKCNSCHEDIHLEGLGPRFREKSCDFCHNNKSFEIEKYDHDMTKFTLENKHAKITCVKCHKKIGISRYKKHNLTIWSDAFIKCRDCHASPHRTEFNERNKKLECSNCHTDVSFNDESKFNNNFDHDKTTFKLLFKHRSLACKKCHVKIKTKNIQFKKGIPKFKFSKVNVETCNSCHEDPHENSLGATCTKCHSIRGWKITNDFHKNFTLNGIHYSLGCAECHNDDRTLKNLSGECQLCHQKDDIHFGSLPSCNECHRQSIWSFTDFRHSLTSFPLRGSHRLLNCINCHSGGIYQGAGSECIDCHNADLNKVVVPLHVLPTFQDCSRCHNQFMF